MLRQTKIAGLSSVGFATMIVLGNLILAPAGPPLPGDDPGTATAFFATESGVVGLTSALAPLTWVLAMLFGAGTVAVLGADLWSLAGFAGLILQNTTFTGIIATRLALTQNDSTALWALNEALFLLNGTFLPLAMVGLSVAGLRAGLIHRWHAGVGFLAATLQFASATLAPLVMEHGGALGFLGLAGWLLWVVWLVAYGVTLIRHQPTRQTTALQPTG